MTAGGRAKGEATARAPATVGNVAVGFDLIGFAMEAPADRVTVRAAEHDEVRVDEIRGIDGLPTDPDANTATAGLVAMREALDLAVGFDVVVDKGIPLSSGLGGSAASAVASVVAAEAVLDVELSPRRRLTFALDGEEVASGSRHADNVAPALAGGLVLCWDSGSSQPVDIPVPESVRAVVVSPDRTIETRRAREVLPETVDMEAAVGQSGRLAAFVAGCYRGDVELLGRAMVDEWVEPHRKELVPGFDRVQEAAREAGALGCSLSGAGPSMFAWVEGDGGAEDVEEAMVDAFRDEGVDSRSWRGPVSEEGVRLVDERVSEYERLRD